MRAVVVSLVVMVLLAGCMVDEKPEGGLDTDGDFLIDDNERLGWNVTITKMGPDCSSRVVDTYHVVSSEEHVDTDGDGVLDPDELAWGSDPTQADSDGDGLRDRDEVQRNRNKSLLLPGTLKPTMADSDGDCLADGDEVNGTVISGLGRRTSDPSVGDTDQDGLTDYHEVRQGFTDPRRYDTDADGAGDGVDADPRRDVVLRLDFVSLRVKRADAGDVRFLYSMKGATGPLNAGDPAFFDAPNGANTTVPGGQSPGRVNVDDAAPFGTLTVEVWIEPENGGLLNITADNADHVVTVAINAQRSTWTAGSQGGRATGGLSWMGASEADVWFRLWVESA